MFEKNLIKFTTVRLQKVLPNFFKGFFFVDGSVFIKIRAKDIKRVLYFFKTHICVRFKQLQDVCVADFLVLKKKFILFYQLLSIDSNFRISVCVCAGRTQSLLSVASLFLSAN
jgi:NADH:ubiquinone oxidoreductase subunit C